MELGACTGLCLSDAVNHRGGKVGDSYAAGAADIEQGQHAAMFELCSISPCIVRKVSWSLIERLTCWHMASLLSRNNSSTPPASLAHKALAHVTPTKLCSGRFQRSQEPFSPGHVNSKVDTLTAP